MCSYGKNLLWELGLLSVYLYVPIDLHDLSQAPLWYFKWLLRFEFQLPHPILSPALATDKKWPLSQFHISCQNSEISWPKVQISDFQSQFSMLKNIPNFLKRFFISGTHFLLLTFFEKYNIYSTLLILKLGPFFVSWFLRFGKRYATDLSVAKVVHRKLIFKS